MPVFSALKGLLRLKVFIPPGSPSMPQGGSSLGNPGVTSFKTNGAPSCAVNTPTCSVSCGVCMGSCSPLDGPSRGSQSCLCMTSLGAAYGSNGGSGSALHLCLCMPSLGASHSGIPSMPGCVRNSSSSGIPSPRHASLFAQVSPPTPGSSWRDWSHAWGREAYLKRVLEKLNLEYPCDSAD
jgi:hypothetical protein